MKKFIKVGALIIGLIVMAIALTSCKGCKGGNGDEPQDPVIVSIEVISSTVPLTIYTDEVNSKLESIQIKVVKSDESSEVVNLNTSMISAADLSKLTTAGTYTIKVTYQSFETNLTITTTKKPDSGSNPGNDGPGNDDPANQDVEYKVFVEDIAGKPLADFYVMFYLGNEVIEEGRTNQEGTFIATLKPNKYDVKIEGREGYYLNQEMFETDLIGSGIYVVAEIDSLAGVEADGFTSYQLGDVMYDFTLTDINGTELTLYELLETKKAVFLNFWYKGCSWCETEFPDIVAAYESSYKDANGETKAYKDDIAIIAVNPTIITPERNKLQDIKDYARIMGLTFNVALDLDADSSNLTFEPLLTSMFSVSGYPTTVIIDSFGLIAEIESGAVIGVEKWTQSFDKYISEDYYPVYTGNTGDGGNELVKPDIDQPESSVLEEAVNGTNYDGSKFEATYAPEDNDDAEYSWPWLADTYLGRDVIKPSNKDVHSSFSIVYMTVYLNEGDVLTFDYFASTEEYDMLYVIVDDTIATSIVGQSPDWETSYAYVAIESKEYEIGFCYLKDESYSKGEDSVFISNMRIQQIADIDKTTYILRECAIGDIIPFTMSYEGYAEVFYNELDGYYHVGSPTGPYLLADMLSGTKWNNSTLYEVSLEGKCIGADGVDYNKVIEEYAVYASNSEVGYAPVTEKLAIALQQVCKALGDPVAASNPDQWLEVCVYYSAYGTNGVELGLPTVGVCPFEPIMFEGTGIETPATASAMIDRIILPRGIIFGFIPSVTGVYKFYSTEEIETQGWICDADGNAIAEPDYGLREFAAKLTKGEKLDNNFVAYIYLEEGELYLFRAGFYDINEYSAIEVEMSYVSSSKELLTIASPGFFTSSDDEMSDIIAGNYVDVVLKDGFYHVKDSYASDTLVYCDWKYLNNITGGYTLEMCASDRFNAFDFSKDEYGQPIRDEDGYYRVTEFDEQNNVVRYYVCYDSLNDEYFYTTEINLEEYPEEAGYTFIKLTDDDMKALGYYDYTEFVRAYVEEHMITDENSELYGCVKVNEEFANALSQLMDKYTFEDVDYSWVKLCYYYKYLGPTLV